MEFLKTKKTPKNREFITQNRKNFVLVQNISNENNENLQLFLDEIFNKNSKKISSVVKNRNSVIGRAIKTNKEIILEQLTAEEIKQIKREKIDKRFPIELEPDNNNDNTTNNLDVIKERKVKEKTKKLIEFGISKDMIEDHNEILDKYKMYEDDDDRFKVRVNNKYVLNNKIGFIADMEKKMSGLEHLVDEDSCDSQSNEDEKFQPLIHQMIVKQYLNSFSPYRGLLLYHGLGSGKTCSSIGIIESMKHNKEKIFIMTPASLQKNYKTQMKFCGNQLFQENNYWEFVEFPKDNTKESFLQEIRVLTHLPLKYLRRKNGVYLVNKSKDGQSNFHSNFNETEKDAIREQIDLMIDNKFNYINYNGISREKWNLQYTDNGERNPFNNSTIVIDEGHNFVSRIVNKLNAKQTSVSTDIYEDIMKAENCNVVILSGTPLINYPCELGVLFNLIGGYNYCVELTMDHKNKRMIDNSKFVKILRSEMKSVDLIEYFPGTNTLRITRNPFGFIRNKDGTIEYDINEERIYSEDFKKQIVGIFNSHNYKILSSKLRKFKKFPDKEEEFKTLFMSNNKKEIKTKLEYFKNKIVGMVSYLGDKKSLMPDIIYDENGEDEDIFIEKIQMNNFTLQKYAEARKIEVEIDDSQKKKAMQKNEDKFSSSYRIFSRSACNFVFPDDIKRPYPRMDLSKMNEDDLENLTGQEMLTHNDGKYDESDVKSMETKVKKAYQKEIDRALDKLHKNASKYFNSEIPKYVNELEDEETDNKSLEKLSPKIHRMLRNLFNEDNKGLHLIYSNFRKLGGIGILINVLDYYGYTPFKLIRENLGSHYEYRLNLEHPYYSNSDFKATNMKERKFYALYTGSETVEEKEIIRNIYNGNLDKIPNSLREQIYNEFGDPTQGELLNNQFGDLINVLIISASGAEGIDLKNVRFVHIMEPYWHPVRISQVIGRARRICSHSALEKEYQNVKVFMYLLSYDKAMVNLIRDNYSQLAIHDIDDNNNLVTTDERLYKIMLKKKEVMERFLTALKEASIDCLVNYENKGKCLSFNPSLQQPNKRAITDINYMNDKKNINVVAKNNRQQYVSNNVELNNTELNNSNTNNNSSSDASMTINKKVYIVKKLFDKENPEEFSFYLIDKDNEPHEVFDLTTYQLNKKLNKIGYMEIGEDNEYFVKTE